MIKIHQLFISPGHNYFGRHGQLARNYPRIEVSQIECVAGRGIRGDRFFDFKKNYKGQITFFSVEVFAALPREFDLPQAQPSATRRNVFVACMDLNSLIDAEFEVQGVRFAGVAECKPCYRMKSDLGASAEDKAAVVCVRTSSVTASCKRRDELSAVTNLNNGRPSVLLV